MTTSTGRWSGKSSESACEAGHLLRDSGAAGCGPVRLSLGIDVGPVGCRGDLVLEVSAFVRWSEPHFKPEKGTALIQRRKRQKAARADEDAAKDIVRARDVRCRWPHCENCRIYKPRLEVAHIQAKGAGGPNVPENMMLLDYLTHQGGTSSLEQHGKRIEPLTAAGTNGPCEFWATDENDQWYLVARERAPFLYERD